MLIRMFPNPKMSNQKKFRKMLTRWESVRLENENFKNLSEYFAHLDSSQNTELNLPGKNYLKFYFI